MAVGSSQSCFFTKAGSNWSSKNVQSLESIKLGVVKSYSFGVTLAPYIKANAKNPKSACDMTLKFCKALPLDPWPSVPSKHDQTVCLSDIVLSPRCFWIQTHCDEVAMALPPKP